MWRCLLIQNTKTVNFSPRFTWHVTHVLVHNDFCVPLSQHSLNQTRLMKLLSWNLMLVGSFFPYSEPVSDFNFFFDICQKWHFSIMNYYPKWILIESKFSHIYSASFDFPVPAPNPFFSFSFLLLDSLTWKGNSAMGPFYRAPRTNTYNTHTW